MRSASYPGSRTVGAWVGATLIGTLIGAALTLTLTPVLEDWVRFHWTLWPGLGGGDFAARATRSFVAYRLVPYTAQRRRLCSGAMSAARCGGSSLRPSRMGSPRWRVLSSTGR